MIPRKPLAPNGRQGHMTEFLSTLESVAPASFKYKSKEQPSIRLWARASMRPQENGASGGGRIVP